jgi:hypothetical protein
VLDTLDIIMGPGKKDEGMREEAIRTHWSMDPVHANLHTYYKLASNLLDHHKNHKSGKVEEVGINKRMRSHSSTTDGGEGSSDNNNPPKKKREDHRARTVGGNKEPRHWPLANPSYRQDRGYNFQKQRHEDNYGHGSYSHVNHYSGSRGAAAPRSRGSRGRGRGGSSNRRFY